jgi:uncharacterized membrane protein YciS (DUF1049 family)
MLCKSWDVFGLVLRTWHRIQIMLVMAVSLGNENQSMIYTPVAYFVSLSLSLSSVFGFALGFRLRGFYICRLHVALALALG